MGVAPIIEQGEMEWSIHPPSLFIQQHWQRLLPGWSTPVLSVLILLQRSPVALNRCSRVTTMVKDCLRNRAIQLVQPVLQHSREDGHHAVIFDPKTGKPYPSTAYGIHLNDVAVIHSLLGYTLEKYGQCHCVLHPTWGNSVYPAIVASSSPPMALTSLTRLYLASSKDISENGRIVEQPSKLKS